MSEWVNENVSNSDQLTVSFTISIKIVSNVEGIDAITGAVTVKINHNLADVITVESEV